MECLKDYVSVLGCGTKVPAGGEYINTLPGISLEIIESLADDEQKNFLGVWGDVQKRALSKFSIEINERFAKKFKLKQIRSTTNLLKRIDKNSTSPAAAVSRGFSWELTSKNSHFVASNLQLFYCESLSFYVIDKTAIGPSVILTVTDLDTEEVLSTFTIDVADVVDGWNDYPVNKFYDTNRIAFAYAAASFEGVNQQLYSPAINGLYNSIKNLYGGYVNPFIRGIEYATIDSPTYGTNTFGLTGVISVVCRFDKIVCQNKASFVYPLMYLLGSELMIEAMSSSRTNFWTTIGQEGAAEKFSDFYAEFDRSLGQVVDSISLNEDDACLVCNELLTYRTTLP